MQKSVQVELQGQIERVTYHNPENAYTIAKVRMQGRRDLVTVVGNLVSLSPGEVLRLKGSWEVHPKFGDQFRVLSYETVMPASVKGIERYLGSGLIKGIGPVMAKRLVESFGTETLNVIEQESGRLSEVPGIGEKRIAMIREAWAEQKEIREVMLFLQSHDVSSAYAARIFRHYGREAIAVVRENPYRLASDIFGIGFRTADAIARKLGIPQDSAIRAEAGIQFVLQQLAGDGHVYCPSGLLIEECAKILEISHPLIHSAMEHLGRERRIVIEDLTHAGSVDAAVYLSELHRCECSVAENLGRLLSVPADTAIPDARRALDATERELGITLAENQRKAVEESLRRKVLVITGGPGTGKTTIIRAIITIFRHSGRRFLLAAPTGRAAKRMSEATGNEARTIHRLLEFSPKEGGFKRQEQNRLETDLVVIDEASMIDTVLMHHLLQAVPDPSTLILVGDIDQLPSVGPGNVLRDIIDAGIVPTARLREIFRQAGESLIVQNAHRINQGELPIGGPVGEQLQDFYFVEREDPEEVSALIVQMCRDRIPRRFGLRPLDDIQVLTPMHRGVTGASHLNMLLQNELNPTKDELSRGGRTFRTGDKVMQIRNNYDREVFNGDIGRVVSIEREEQEVVVDFDGRRVSYDFSELDELVLAYAISVHKSQGSEYPAVVLPLLTQHYLLLQRNLLYTAVTRGKRLVVIIGTRKALAMAVRNDKQGQRHTSLQQRLRRTIALL